MRTDTLRVLTRVLAIAMIAYSTIMLSQLGLELQHGRAIFVEEVEALRPARVTPSAGPSLQNAPSLDAAEESAAEQAVIVTEEAGASLAGLSGEAKPTGKPGESEPGAVTPQSQEAPGGAEFDLAALQQINPDIAGWLILDGTKIDFPVLLDRKAREEYLTTGTVTWAEGVDRQELVYKYLFYDYLGNRSELGSVTADYHSALTDPYVLIYGHNAGQSGVMFSDLTRFLSSEFCAEHQTGALYTESGTAELELLAVALISGYTQEVFGEETEPSAVLAYIVQNAVFLSPDARRLGNDFTGEQLVVLSTCAIARHPEDPARLVVAYRAGN